MTKLSTDNEQRMSLRERKKAKTMEAIQSHAMRLFRERGYNSTTIEQIADAAEVSPSTFFRYFPTKEDVVIKDSYDPMLIAAFEAQPSDLSAIQAVRSAMIASLTKFSKLEFATLRERNQLIMAVPELRAATMNNLTDTMQLFAEMLANRVGRSKDDLAVQTFAGALIGISMSVMMYYAENPESDFIQTLDESFAFLESGMQL
ncbi:TetR family transcriptional regulator [Paenibacillus sp. L3-i20]|uniref:acyl-CoA-like ligand-binding transcription factor n=1 Tax=Paenibacillus sp. L3-i20 TaxID=2905833 RepID=UPI0028525587|nr:TetR family transcriptional regulator [Paenibacillus sp. L3-i20]